MVPSNEVLFSFKILNKTQGIVTPPKENIGGSCCQRSPVGLGEWKAGLLGESFPLIPRRSSLISSINAFGQLEGDLAACLL